MVRASLAFVGVAVLVAGCGGGAGDSKAAAGDCKRLIAATTLVDPALTEITEIPSSNADALHRIADAASVTRAALRRASATSAEGTAAHARTQFVSALTALVEELGVARVDLRTGHTQQERSQGYVDAGVGIDKVHAAETSVVAACPSSG